MRDLRRSSSVRGWSCIVIGTHAPLEAPVRYRTPSYWKDEAVQSRQAFNAMVSALDDGVKNVTDALRTTGLWGNTVLLFSADNGGETSSAGNNFPLRLPLKLPSRDSFGLSGALRGMYRFHPRWRRLQFCGISQAIC